MKTRTIPVLYISILAISACSGGGSDVVSDIQAPPSILGVASDPQVIPEPITDETPVLEEVLVTEQPVVQKPESTPVPATETPVTEPAPEPTPGPSTEEEDEAQPQDPSLTPEEDEVGGLVGYYKMTDVYNGAVLELPRRDFLGMQTTTFVIISSVNEDGTITTGLLDIKMPEDGIFYAKLPEANVYAEYGVLDRDGELCRVSSANADDFMQFITNFMVTTIVNPESLPTCRELDAADSYPGYFVVDLSTFSATDCDLVTPRFDISIGAEVEWPLCKLFYKRVLGEDVVGYYEMSFALDQSIALIPLEHMGDIFTIEEDVIGVLLKSDSLESEENLCMVGDITELGSNINYFGYIPSQSCTED